MDIDFSPDDRRFAEEVRGWLHANVPQQKRPPEGQAARTFDLAWQARQYEGGWAGISWPREYGGRGLSLVRQIIWHEEYARAEAPHAGSSFVGLNHGGPTLMACGTQEQKRRYLPPILKGEAIWCQGFSEPGAGSDLASLRTSARIDGDELVISGQKIWTSFAHLADYQELLVRTDPAAPKHKGLTWLIMDMRSPGITVRPIRSISGVEEFCEVFYEDVRAPLANVVGAINDGWRVAMSTLGFERGTAFMADQVRLAQTVDRLVERAASQIGPDGQSLLADGAVAERLALLRAEVAALRSMTYAAVSRLTEGEVPGPGGSMIRLYMSELSQRVTRQAAELVGPAILDRDDSGHGPGFEYLARFSATIGGGTSQIQRNIIGERVLGLPR